MTRKITVFFKTYRYWLIQAALLILPVSQALAEGESDTFATTFMLQQKEGQYCLTLDVRDNEFSSCVYQDPEQSGLCYPRNRTVLKSCDEQLETQRWSFDYQKKRIYYQGYSIAMCLSRMVETVEMLPCSDASQGQIWFFNDNEELLTAADAEFPQGYLRLLGQDEFDPKSLTFKFSTADMSERKCFKSPLSGSIECSLPEQPSFPEPEPEPEPDSGEEGTSDNKPDQNEGGKQKPPQEEPAPSPPVRPAVRWDDPQGLFWVSDKLTQDIEFTYAINTICLQVEEPLACLKNNDYSRECYSGQRVTTATCFGQDESLWKHDLKTKRIFNKSAGYRYCLTWLQNQLLLMPCFAGISPVQKWYFGLGNTSASLERGRLKSSAQGALYPFDYQQVLDLPLSYGSTSGINGERSVRYEPFGELCGFEPVEGKWTGDCVN